MTEPQALDVAYCRSFFPGLSDDWAFFENAGGTMVPTQVIDRVRDYMTHCQVQPGAKFAASAEAARRMAEGRRAMAALINAAPDEIVIGPNTTANVYALSHGIRPWFDAGDEIVVTNQDHEANSGAWRRWESTGITVREWRIDPETGELRIEDLEPLLNERTRLVCFPWCSNIVGSLNDAAAITRRVHDAGALVCIDGVAYAPHRRVDVKAVDADFFVFSPYKVFGPQSGVLYGKRELLERAENQMHFFLADNTMLKLNPGGPNHELSAALSGITAYVDALDAHHFGDDGADLSTRISRVWDLFTRHEAVLAGRFADFLVSRNTVRLFGCRDGAVEHRVPVFSFLVDGRASDSVSDALEPEGLAFRNGDFYAARCIDALGARQHNGVVRVSMVHYNTIEEVDRLIRGLDAVL